jgi:hypothetical protein
MEYEANLEGFFEAMKHLEKTSEILGKTQDLRIDKRSGFDELKKIGYNALISENQIVDKSIEEIDDKKLENGFRYSQGIAKELSDNILYRERDSILWEIEDSSLEKIISHGEIREKVPKDYSDFMEKFDSYIIPKNFLEKFNNNELSDEGKKEKRKLAIKGAMENQEVYCRNKGYSDDLIDFSKNLVRNSVMEGYISDDRIEKYATEHVNKLKEDFDNYSKNVGKNIADISRETLGHMIDGTSKEFETAKSGIYISLKE